MRSFCGDAIVELVPRVVAPHYWCWRVHYLLAKIVISCAVPRVVCFDA